MPRQYLFATTALLLLAAPAHAETTTINTQGGKFVIAPEQQLMLDAAKKVLEKDYPAALSLYDQAIAINGGNVQAYIQRSVVKRETGDASGSQQDAIMAVRTSEAELQRDPQNAKLYYQRGTGYRLLKDFAKARENINYAIQLSAGKRGDWASDLKAIELEEKMAQ